MLIDMSPLVPQLKAWYDVQQKTIKNNKGQDRPSATPIGSSVSITLCYHHT